MTGLTRRRFIQGTLACGAGLSLLPRVALAGSAGGAGDTLVLVVLRGGLDGLSALVPLGDGAAYHDARRRAAVPEHRALPLDDHWGLHPALAPLHELHQDGVLALVPAAGSPDPSRSHFDQQAVLERGATTRVVGTPGWLARLLAQRQAGPLQAIAGAPQLPMVLHGAPAATAVPSLDGLAGRLATTGDLGSGGATLRRLAGAGPIGDAAATSIAAGGALIEVARAGSARDGYPERHGVRSLGDVARILHAGVDLDAAVVDVGGWDLHAGMGDVDSGPMQALLRDLAQGLATFHHDTAALDRKVTTVAISEFGRTLSVNASGGTDHGRAGLVWLLGPGVQGGVHGPWPGLAPDDLDAGGVAVTTDFRDVLAEVAEIRLGATDLAAIFPGHQPSRVGLTRS